VTDYGVTADGFVVKDLAAIRDSMTAKIREVYGDDIDLSDTTLAGQLLQSTAYAIAECWQVLESVHYAGFLNTAAKTNLDAVAVIQGIARKAATPATGTVRFSRTTISAVSYAIPAGTRVSNADGSLIFETTADGVLEAGFLTVDIAAECMTPGVAGNVTAGIITHIMDTISGIESVTNPTAMEDGTDAESDPMLRIRTRVPSTTSKATLIAMEQALAAVTGVIDVLVTEDTDHHTATCYVLGGSDGDLNAVIAATRPCGIIASLARPNAVPVAVTVTVLKASTITSEAVEANTNAALAAFFASLPISEDVAYSDIIRVIANTTGVENVNALTATGGGSTLDALGETLAIADSSVATNGTHTITVV